MNNGTLNTEQTSSSNVCCTTKLKKGDYCKAYAFYLDDPERTECNPCNLV